MSTIYSNQFNFGKEAPPDIQRKAQIYRASVEKLLKLHEKRNQVCNAYQTVRKELEKYSASIAPITTIPNEVLSTIFLEVVNSPFNWHEVDLATLTEVCRHWRDVAINNPLLWNRIRIEIYPKPIRTLRQLHYIDVFLERSKNVLLDIDVTFFKRMESEEYVRTRVKKLAERLSPPTLAPAMEEWIKDYLKSAPPTSIYPAILTELLTRVTGPHGEHMARWGSVHLSLDSEWYASHWKLFKGQAPNLKLLEVYTGSYSSIFGPDPIFPVEKRGSFRRLQSLECLTLYTGFHLSSFHFHPETLTSLEFWETPEWSNIKLLSSFINLKKLIYRTKYRLAEREPPEIPEICLPSVERLELSGHHHNMVFNILDLPNLSNLHVSAYLGRVDDYPTGRMFHNASEITIFWSCMGEVSDSDTVRLLKGLLKQCTSVVKIVAARWIKRQMFQAVEECRAVPGGLKSLRMVTIDLTDAITIDDTSPSTIEYTN